MFDFNSDVSNALIGQDTGSASLELPLNQLDDIFPLPEASVGSTLGLSPESDETLVLRGSKDFDFLFGKDSNDTLYGLSGGDLLNGKEGDDIINGGTDKDWLVGEKGNDILIDGDGGDLMEGGEGADEFWIHNWDTPDKPSIISDFHVGEDTIKIGQLGATFDSLTFKDNKESTTIYNEGKALAVLTDVDKESLTSESFVFGDAALVNQLQTNLDNSIEASENPGATQAIVTPDGFTWKGAAGLSDIETQESMQPDDIFSIASTTKTFTAATVLKVVESGHLSLDDTLGQSLPEIAKNFPDGEDITLRQLLNGSSGIPSFDRVPSTPENFSEDLANDTFADKSPEEIVSYVYDEPLFSGLGSSPIWAYTNTADIIASLMVEQATGQDFAKVMQENVIKPLGLDDTSYGLPEQLPENLARSYTDIFDSSGNFLAFDGEVDDVTEFDVKNISNFGASGALFSNAEDTARFTQALFGGELLSKDSLNELVNFVDTGSLGSRYGLGVSETPYALIPSLGRLWELGGVSYGHASRTLYLPDEGGYINTVLTNRQYRSETNVQLSAQPILISSLEVLIDDFSTQLVATETNTNESV